MNVGPFEVIVVLLIVLLLFGSTKLPKLARSIGEASKEFKKGVNEGANEPETAASPPAATGVAPTEEKVTMTKAELDALLAEREAQIRKDVPPPSA